MPGSTGISTEVDQLAVHPAAGGGKGEGGRGGGGGGGVEEAGNTQQTQGTLSTMDRLSYTTHCKVLTFGHYRW